MQTSNELYALLSEDAELRRTVTDLMLETALLRETLVNADSNKDSCNPEHSGRPRQTANA